MDDDYPSINLNHILENEESNLQVDSSNSFPPTSQVDKDTAILIASDALSLSEKEQKRCIMFANLANYRNLKHRKKILFTGRINKY